MANEAHIREVSEKELHSLIEVAEHSLDENKNSIEKLQRALDGDPDKKDDAGNPLEPGMRAELTAMAEELADTRQCMTDVLEEFKKVDERTDRSDKVWRAYEDADPRGFHTKTYRALADVYNASYDSWKKDNYASSPEGHTRAADQSSTTDTQGGILVPTATWENVAYIIGQKSFLRAYGTQVPLPTDDLKVPYLPEIPTMYVQGTQGVEPTHGSLIFDDTQMLSAKTYLGINVIPNQLVQDAVRIWATFWARVFTDAMALKENKGMFSEKPTDANGAFSGVIQEVEGATTNKHEYYLGGSSTSGSTHFSTLSYDDLVEIQSLPNENSADGNRWFMHRNVGKYIRKLKTTDGFPLIGPMTQGMASMNPKPDTQGPRSTPLLSDPMHETSAMPGTNAVSKSVIVYGNPAYTFWGERAPMSIEFSKESQFKDYATVMRVAERIAQKTIAVDAYSIGRVAAS